MNMQEIARFILWLQAAGWTGDEINRFMLYIESGNEIYLPEKKEQKNTNSD